MQQSCDSARVSWYRPVAHAAYTHTCTHTHLPECVWKPGAGAQVFVCVCVCVCVCMCVYSN